MKTSIDSLGNLALSQTVAPEDFARGDYVAILHEYVEYPAYMWRDDFGSSPERHVWVRSIPNGSGWPLKIKAICLPFLFVKTAHGQYETLDIRRWQLVRLDAEYAREVWDCLQKQRTTA